ncbi:MAG: hypothetical protein ACOX1P_16495 [Thermoguttaceae bacterium]|jgi:hypothetical protein
MRSLTENETTMLAEMLGEQDAAIWPIRLGGAGDERIRVQAEIAADLRSGGLVFRRGGDDATRKQRERTRASLVELGLATISKPKSTAPRIQLTDRGDTVARVLAGLPTFADSLGLLGQMLKQRGRASNGILDGCGGQAWHREDSLTGARIGSKRYGEAFTALAQRFAPLAARGFAEYSSSLDGMLWFTLTEAGLQRAKEHAGGAALPHTPVDVEFDESHWEAYLAAWEGGYWGLASMEVQHPSEIGPAPFPSDPDTLGDLRRQRRKEPPTCI